ncbi:MAG: hypothetical protein HY907_17935 [Deltaproteobacteria bacterium]|nr:hypothetical protein [Deltaproteobacteria bacterium]
MSCQGPVLLLLLCVLSCGRRGPAELTGVPGEKSVDGPAEVTLRYRPPAGARVVCPAYYETTVSAVGIDRPIQQTLGGEREDVEYVEAVDGDRRTVRRRFGETRWTTAVPLPAPETRDLPPTESTLTIDAAGRVEGGTADQSVSLAMAAWAKQFDVVPGWPETPLRRGDSLPRPLRGPGPPGTGATLEAAAPLKLVDFIEVGGRRCAKFRSDVSGWLLFRPPGEPEGAAPARSTFRATGWLAFDLETGLLLGAAHALHYALPLPGSNRQQAVPEFRITLRSGPCVYDPGP